MCNKLYVVLDNMYRDVAFTTRDKDIVDAFFNRKSREKHYFYVVEKDKHKIAKLEKDFSDKVFECMGEVVMLEHEYESMSMALPGLVDDLVGEIQKVIRNLENFKLTEEEYNAVIDGMRIYYNRLKLFYEDECCEDIFDDELIMDHYLTDMGVEKGEVVCNI